MRVIILGGSGFIGRALTQALISRGDEVVVPTRHVPAATPSTGPEYQLWDGQDHSSLSQLLNGADAVINLLGENIAAKRWSSAQKERIISSRLLAGQALVIALQMPIVKPKVLIQASAIGYYGFWRKRFGSRLYRRQSRRFRFFGDHHHPMGTFNTAGGTFGTPPVHHPDSARVGIGWRYACQAAPGVSAWAWRAGGDRKAAVRLDSS